jgi:RNA polymerase sigma-70 factor, ECF subfamily
LTPRADRGWLWALLSSPIYYNETAPRFPSSANKKLLAEAFFAKLRRDPRGNTTEAPVTIRLRQFSDQEGTSMAGEITRLLARWGAGEREALDELVALVYDELHQLAAKHLYRQGPFPSLQPTLLVHEVWLRLVNSGTTKWEDRAQFFGLAATVMRHLLLDHVRARQMEKHGGGALRVSVSVAEGIGRAPDIDLLALDEALRRMADIKPQHARIVELRFFGGLTIEETATLIGVTHATVERQWTFAKAWLHHELSR